jgi:hypothetical protein
LGAPVIAIEALPILRFWIVDERAFAEQELVATASIASAVMPMPRTEA